MIAQWNSSRIVGNATRISINFVLVFISQERKVMWENLEHILINSWISCCWLLENHELLLAHHLLTILLQLEEIVTFHFSHFLGFSQSPSPFICFLLHRKISSWAIFSITQLFSWTTLSIDVRRVLSKTFRINSKDVHRRQFWLLLMFETRLQPIFILGKYRKKEKVFREKLKKNFQLMKLSSKCLRYLMNHVENQKLFPPALDEILHFHSDDVTSLPAWIILFIVELLTRLLLKNIEIKSSFYDYFHLFSSSFFIIFFLNRKSIEYFGFSFHRYISSLLFFGFLISNSKGKKRKRSFKFLLNTFSLFFYIEENFKFFFARSFSLTQLRTKNEICWRINIFMFFLTFQLKLHFPFGSFPSKVPANSLCW